MKLFSTAAILVACAVIAAGLTTREHLSAENVIERALDASMNTTSRVGNTTWIEDCGVGINLPPAPPADSFPRLLAGDADDPAAFYELGPEGLAALRARMEDSQFGEAGDHSFKPRVHPEAVAARLTPVTLTGARVGLVVDWNTAGRNYALLTTGDTHDRAARRSGYLLRRMVLMPDVGEQGVAPLVMRGAYAFVLHGWQRHGERLHRHTPRGWLSVRVFHLPRDGFVSLVALQNDLEGKLKDAGYNRSDAIQPSIAGTTGTVGEYFGDDGFVQRIAYAAFPEGFMVALMQAPEGSRRELAAQMDAFTGSLRATGLQHADAPDLPFEQVRGLRLAAWQNGREVLWGVLFDGAGGEPVLWRQPGVDWRATLDGPGEGIARKVGTADSSRELNLLVDAESRALVLPPNFTGEVELRIVMDDREAATTLLIR